MGTRIYPSNQSTNAEAIGTLIFTYTDDITTGGIQVRINNVLIDTLRRPQKDGLYSCNVNKGDLVSISFNTTSGTRKIDISRRDYTTDDINGNNGIIDTVIGSSTSSGTLTYVFFPTSLNTAYKFEYRFNCYKV